MSGSDDGHRHPRNLQGLLRFCIENTRDEDAPAGGATLAPMTDENRRWLREAMQSMNQNDPVKIMLQDVKVIMELGDMEEELEQKQDSLDNLQQYCEDMDLANDFHKIGGYTLLRVLLSSPHDGLRWRTAQLIATLVQNNPYSQSAVLEEGLLPRLLETLESCDSSETARVKSLHAISCLIRDFEPTQEAFIQQDGFSVVMRAMQSGVDRLQCKAAFLLASLCSQEKTYKDPLCNMGMVEQLIALLHSDHRDFHEHLTRALLSLASDHQGAVEECRRPELKLRPLLQRKKAELKDKAEFEEELDYCLQLEKTCFSTTPTAATVDR